MRGAESSLRRAGRRALIGVASLLVAGTLAVVSLPGGPVSIGEGPADGVASAADVTPPTPTNSSYGIVDAAGGVMTFGGAAYSGDTLGYTLDKPIVGAAANPGSGYWLVASDGGLFAFGGAPFWGSAGGLPLNKPIVGMAATPGGAGYWLVASDGGIFAYGDAQFYGSTGSVHLNKPIVGMAATPDGAGYWLVASDGGIFAYGDAQFYGSTGSIHLNQPIVGMAATPRGAGYLLVASDGGIFTYGDAQFYGSTGSLSLNKPIVGMAVTPGGGGYWLVAQDAGVFTYGDAQFAGSAQSPLHPPLFPANLSNVIPPVVTIMNEATGPQATHAGGLRVAFAGDSLALYEGQYIQQMAPPYGLDNGAAAGCGFTNGAAIDEWSNPGPLFLNPAACAFWANQLQWVVSRFHPDVTVIQNGYWEAQIRQFNGNWETLANADYAYYIKSNLEAAVQIAHSNGGAVVLSTAPYFADGTPNNLVDAYNSIVEGVASEFPYVSVDDVHADLDPGGTYQAVIDGIATRGADGVHITQGAVDYLIAPALNQIIANVAGAVYTGGA
ncbi:MAG TPA: hypothetical protein VNV83_08410 [Acidimicrobiales bacterium]|nr:hypothetical protein [Acidimicrobiales bacterium]